MGGVDLISLKVKLEKGAAHAGKTFTESEKNMNKSNKKL